MTIWTSMSRAGYGSRRILLLCVALLLASACSNRAGRELLVTLAVDGGERSFLLEGPMTVSALLTRTGIEQGPLDRIEPAPNSVVKDGMRVTIVRVEELQECDRVEIPFRVVGKAQEPSGSLQTLRTQVGIPGEEERCYLVRLENGTRRHRDELSRVVIREPVDEIWQPSGLEPLPVHGTLVWLSGGDAWLARNDSSRMRQVTHSGNLDAAVLELSDSGDSLLFTQKPGPGEAASAMNQLWLIADLNNPDRATRLLPEDVTSASWLPGSSQEFGYTGAASGRALSHVRIDPDSGETLAYRELNVPAREQQQAGAGMRFAWSPDGRLLAWARGNTIGLLETGNASGRILASGDYPASRSIRCGFPSLSWSADAEFLFADLPAADEEGASVSALDVSGQYQIPLVEAAGPCPAPRLAPGQATGLLAYLRARDPARPFSRAGYDLMTVDRDGSNPRLLFPATGQPGLKHQKVAWSPDARRLAFIHDDRLWLYDFESDAAQEFPFPAAATAPDWAG